MLTQQGKAQHWTKETIDQAIKRFVQRHQRAPQKHEWARSNQLPSRSTAWRHYGTMTAVFIPTPAKQARGPYHKDAQKRRWAPSAQIAAVRLFHEHCDRWPETKDFQTDPHLPDPTTVHRAFGTLAALRRQAGMAGGGHEGHGGAGRGGRKAQYDR